VVLDDQHPATIGLPGSLEQSGLDPFSVGQLARLPAYRRRQPHSGIHVAPCRCRTSKPV